MQLPTSVTTEIGYGCVEAFLEEVVKINPGSVQHFETKISSETGDQKSVVNKNSTGIGDSNPRDKRIKKGNKKTVVPPNKSSNEGDNKPDVCDESISKTEDKKYMKFAFLMLDVFAFATALSNICIRTLDGGHMYHMKLICLIIEIISGDGSRIPLAVALCETENYDNWVLFFKVSP